ncbi:DUF1150 family protein [Micavibrio aeruginosavorus]|uniref:DUF1150 family protein n=1 Tax=Micavibrio aeruginosavorus TaxID=349221 RepID=UPI003F4AB31D
MTDCKTTDCKSASGLRDISAQDFLGFGVQHFAYVRPAILNGQKVFSIHAADGTPLGYHDNFDAALVLTRQNDLEPVRVQ